MHIYSREVNKVHANDSSISEFSVQHETNTGVCVRFADSLRFAVCPEGHVVTNLWSGLPPTRPRANAARCVCAGIKLSQFL